MANPIHLPIELLLLIAKFLPLSDTVNLSSCNSTLRIALIPLVFESIFFSNDQGKADGVLSFVRRHSNLVRNLTFTCIFDLDADVQTHTPPLDTARISGEKDHDAGIEFERTLLPEFADTLLRGVHTPEVTTMTLRFNMAPGLNLSQSSLDALDDSFDYVSETSLRFQAQAQALITSTWRTVAANPHIKHLKVPQLLPKVPPVFNEPAMKRFLAQLETLDINIHRVDPLLSKRTSQLYGRFAGDFGSLVLQEMAGLRRLTLSWRPDAPAGMSNTGQGRPYAMIYGRYDARYSSPMEDDIASGYYGVYILPNTLCMPCLRILELSQWIVCPFTNRFIKEHRESLRILRLIQCAAHADENGWECGSWEIFFLDLVEFETQLTEISVEPWDAAVEGAFRIGCETGIAFTYVRHDWSLVQDDSWAVRDGQQEKDAVAFDRLQAQIAENRIRLGLE